MSLINRRHEDLVSSGQLSLLITHDKNTLENYLITKTGKSLYLSITDNSTIMLSIKTKGKSVFVRLHRMFLKAGDDVIKEIAEFIINRKCRTRLIGSFIKENRHCLKKKPQKTISAHTFGKYHDLKALFDSVNDEYFRGRITASITWGNKIPRWMVRRRTLGSYSVQTKTIRIHVCLDRKNVPKYFLKFVLYHEMLHSDMQEEKKNGRRLIHSAEFKRRERLFDCYEKAIAWEKRH
jgi:hypothetical protein